MSGALEPREYFLRKGYIYVPHVPTLIATVVGTGVCVCLWDRKRKTGGMGHYLYPVPEKGAKTTPIYGTVSIYALVRIFRKNGSKVKDLEAQIFGGAVRDRLDREAFKIAQQNIFVARKVIRRYGVCIVAEDVGGERGRKIVFNTHSNEVAIMHVERIRQEDWYPYEGDR
ncbi:MAG: chemotaxis protein CheD [Deltaproteobacteria bacterium]|nr:chemotaxis protein CheD [Deltaproteobacteria bacterium]MBW2068208.1 chemotaxis protein CheD [Deltaproteobacteria bacterium]